MLYNDDTLYHYGVKGMKWGVRRYQNYDGSYTQRGLSRYKKAVGKFEEAEQSRKNAKAAYKANTNEANKRNYKKAKTAAKNARDNANKAYDRLKDDRRADQGKKLYAKGKTITGTSINQQRVQMAIAIGSAAVNQYLRKNKDVKTANLASGAIAIGGSAVNAIIYGRRNYINKRLRAYYAH